MSWVAPQGLRPKFCTAKTAVASALSGEGRVFRGAGQGVSDFAASRVGGSVSSAGVTISVALPLGQEFGNQFQQTTEILNIRTAAKILAKVHPSTASTVLRLPQAKLLRL